MPPARRPASRRQIASSGTDDSRGWRPIDEERYRDTEHNQVQDGVMRVIPHAGPNAGIRSFAPRGPRHELYARLGCSRTARARASSSVSPPRIVR